MRVRVVERPSDVAGGGEGVHEPAGDLAVGAAAERELAPPPRRLRGITRRSPLLGERPERVVVARLESLPLPVHPGAERLRVVEEEAVEERPAVARHGAAEVPRVERLLERVDVAPEQPRLDAQLLAGGEERLRPEAPAELVEGDAEEVAGGRLVALGPEEPDELVAPHAGRVRAHEQGEQRQPPPVRDRSAERGAVRREHGGPPEEAELERRGGAAGRHMTATLLAPQVMRKPQDVVRPSLRR